MQSLCIREKCENLLSALQYVWLMRKVMSRMAKYQEISPSSKHFVDKEISINVMGTPVY